MESLAAAVSLARALLALWRSEQSGVLEIRTELGESRFAIDRGRVRAASPLPCVDTALGDTLLCAGALDAAAHAGILGQRSLDGERVGAWLVRSGLTTRGALEASLRRQLRERVLAVFSCSCLEYRFEAGARDASLSMIDEEMSVGDLVLCALRKRLEPAAPRAPEAHGAGVILRLNALGQSLTRSASLWPEEAAVAALLARGASAARIDALICGHRRARDFVRALSLLHAIETTAARMQFSLLLRKRAQLRRGASARALLELAHDATPVDARRALRKLALGLHPDALGPDAPAALLKASGEVMGALIAAERELRDGAERSA